MLLLVSAWQRAPCLTRQQESSQQRSGQFAKQGSNFNKFFPPAGNGFERVYTREKKALQAKLKKAGVRMALLSSFLIHSANAAAKYQQSTKKIAGYPARDWQYSNRCSRGRSLPSQSHFAIPPLPRVIAQLGWKDLISMAWLD